MERRCVFEAGDALRAAGGGGRGEEAAGDGGGRPADGGGARSGDATMDYALLQPTTPPVTIVVLYLVPDALRLVEPVVRALWNRGGVTVVTCKYHYTGWNYTVADTAYDVRVIDRKGGQGKGGDGGGEGEAEAAT